MPIFSILSNGISIDFAMNSVPESPIFQYLSGWQLITRFPYRDTYQLMLVYKPEVSNAFLNGVVLPFDRKRSRTKTIFVFGWIFFFFSEENTELDCIYPKICTDCPNDISTFCFQGRVNKWRLCDDLCPAFFRRPFNEEFDFCTLSVRFDRIVFDPVDEFVRNIVWHNEYACTSVTDTFLGIVQPDFEVYLACRRGWRELL